MDTPRPYREEELNEIERRLSVWQPATDNLHSDALLFAAGRAAARRGPAALLWPLACGVLSVLAVSLAFWGFSEHAECQALAGRLRQVGPENRSPTAIAAAENVEPYRSSPEDYLSMLHALEKDTSSWLNAPTAVVPLAFASPPPRPVILTPRSRNELVDP